MDCKLVVSSGPLRGLELALDEPRAYTIGRSNAADLTISDSGISRVHCEIVGDGTTWTLRDRGSRNGVRVGGEQVTEHVLSAGDDFSFGRTTNIRFEVAESTAEMPEDAAGGFSAEPVSIPPVALTVAGAVAATEPSLVGRDLGEFRVAERLDHSPASTTYRALQTTLNRNVLLQVFNRACSSDPAFRDEVIDRVRRVSPLIHPSIVQLFDLEEADGMLFVVMEHFKGRTLAAHLAKQHFVPIRSAIQVAQQLCDALMHADEMQFPVASIDPDEILVDDEYRTKIQFFHEPGRGDEKPSLDALAHRAPELLSPTPRGSGASAVYSIGSALYQMVGGIPPFKADNADLLRAKILRDDPPSLRKLNYGASPALCEMISRTMAKKPADRPAGAGALDVELKKITSAVAR